MERSYFFVRHGRAVYQSRRDLRAYVARSAAGHGRTAGEGAFHSPPLHSSVRAPDAPDWPLTDRGHAQARAVTRPLLSSGVERVVSSRLRRARQTASRIAECGLPYAHAWDDLNEVEPRHLRVAGLPRRWPEPPDWWSGVQMARAMRRHVWGLPASGWRVSGVEARIRRVLSRLDRMAERRIAVVGHGFWILLATVALDGPLRLRWIENGSVTRVDADGRGRYRVVCFATPLVSSTPIHLSSPAGMRTITE